MSCFFNTVQWRGFSEAQAKVQFILKYLFQTSNYAHSSLTRKPITLAVLQSQRQHVLIKCYASGGNQCGAAIPCPRIVEASQFCPMPVSEMKTRSL